VSNKRANEKQKKRSASDSPKESAKKLGRKERRRVVAR
jgi:hypothetical protein